MTSNTFTKEGEEPLKKQPLNKTKLKKRLVGVAAFSLLAGGGVLFTNHFLNTASAANQSAIVQLPIVSVSEPIKRKIESQLQALGQFSAVDNVELRAQVGGTLKEIRFKDGDIVHKGDVLFVIDSTPYLIKLNEASALRESAKAKLDLATRELDRAETLKTSGAGTVESADQRSAEMQAARASLDDAEAQVRDAQFDLDHCRITAPFTGRIGTHMVSIGNLISGSRAGSSPTTLLATIVSLDPIYLDFDISETDYMTFLHGREKQNGPLANKVAISLSDDIHFDHEGTLNFIDNTLNRASGTIHARAIVANSDFQITPGSFGRVKVAISAPTDALMVPDASVLQDQAQHMVFTVSADNIVTPKNVETGELRDGLRVINSGLESTDKVIVDSIPIIHVGEKISPSLKTITATAEQQ